MTDAQNELQKSKRSNARKIPKTLTRRDLYAAVAKRLGQKPSEVSDYVDATIDSLANLIKTADPELRIELRGLGVFEVKFMKEKAIVRDPRTLEIIEYKGRRRKMHFRPSKQIKRVLQGGAKGKTE
ncbi:MAG: HU family DNA-binding protein [Chloroherpetonaceae bacterium]|nr:HU family DNA-binding protein [Chloroherpetonaceae bacterium]